MLYPNQGWDVGEGKNTKMDLKIVGNHKLELNEGRLKQKMLESNKNLP